MTSAASQDGRRLPAGWRWLRLGDLASEPDTFADGPFGSHLKTAHYSSSGARVIRLQNVGRGVFLDHDRAFISLEHFAGLTRHGVVAGDIIVAALGDGARPAGRACMVPEGLAPALVKADCFRVRLPEDIVHPPYLTAYLNSAESLGRIRGMMRGATRPRVTLGMLRALMMPMPPVGEQRRISARLAGWLTAIDQARAAAKTQLEAAKSLPAAYLRRIFSGPVPPTWRRRTLGELCEIQLGKMLSPDSRQGLDPRPYLRNANVQWNRFDLSSVLAMDFSNAEAEKFELRSGDVLVCEGGEPGRAAVWEGQIRPCYYQKALHRLRVRNDAAMPDFLMYRLWFSSLTQEFVESHAKTTIAHLPAVRLEGLPMAVPPLLEQRRIVRALKEQLAEASRLRKTAEEQLRAVDAIPPTLLRRAFSGAL